MTVRRLRLLIEEGLHRDMRWAVFEPNDKALWAKMRKLAGDFMLDLFRRGAFAGRTPDEAYFVKCDAQTTTQADIDNGIVKLEVGFAPLKPAGFVIVRILQRAGHG